MINTKHLQFVTECTHCEHYHELVKRIDELENHYKKRIDELEQRLSYYENAHSPPSKDSLYWRQQKKERKRTPSSKPDRNQAIPAQPTT